MSVTPFPVKELPKDESHRICELVGSAINDFCQSNPDVNAGLVMQEFLLAWAFWASQPCPGCARRLLTAGIRQLESVLDDLGTEHLH